MADHSKIEWTNTTWNPIAGCTAVSPGCDRCYAARLASGRLSHTPLYTGLAKDGVFTGEVRLVPERLTDPLHWRKPRMVFVNSMSDLFHDKVPTEFIFDVFQVMARTPQHTYQILTKRPGRMGSLLRGVVRGWDNPLPNVWLVVSVEDQQWAGIRIPALMDTPAAVRGISAEPLLGPVALQTWLGRSKSGLNWVICGGETGPGSRPMHPDWARSLRDQCQEAEVPFFFKQWGEWQSTGGDGRATHRISLDGRHYPNPATCVMSGEELIERVGKTRAGRLLDGREWNEYPT